MSESDWLADALAEHESVYGSDDYTSCICGERTVNLGGLRAHVAATLRALIHARVDGAEDDVADEIRSLVALREPTPFEGMDATLAALAAIKAAL